MEGKAKSKRKLWKVLLLAMSFVLVIVLTASVTLAWFYDSDWANKEVLMAGAVGIEMRDSSGKTSGEGAFHFEITGEKAYPGQAVDVEASVFNNGGKSGTKWWATSTHNDGTDDQIGVQEEGTETADDAAAEQAALAASGEGSACFVRAKFLVYTNIGTELNPDWTDGDDIDDKYISDDDATHFNATALYNTLISLITARNTGSTDYSWVFWQNADARMPIGNNTTDRATYYNGTTTSSTDAIADGGYFYLCYAEGNTSKPTGSTAKTLYPLPVGEDAKFLWDGTYVIPWQLTNASADKTIFVAVTFQAIQTFIPRMSASVVDGDIGGIISSEANNQLELIYCNYDDRSVQTVFNSSVFASISKISTVTRDMNDDGDTEDDDDKYDYSTQGKADGFAVVTIPANDHSVYLSGTVAENTARP